MYARKPKKSFAKKKKNYVTVSWCKDILHSTVTSLETALKFCSVKYDAETDYSNNPLHLQL